MDSQKVLPEGRTGSVICYFAVTFIRVSISGKVGKFAGG